MVEPGQLRRWRHSGGTFLVVQLLSKPSPAVAMPLVVIVHDGRQFVEPESFVLDNSEIVEASWRENGLRPGDLVLVKNRESGTWQHGLITDVRQPDGPLRTLGLEEFCVLVAGRRCRLFSYEMLPIEEGYSGGD